MDKFALVLVIIGALNLLMAGLFRFDFIASIFGGETTVMARIIYSVIGAGGLWCIGLLAKLFKVTGEKD